jgi:hypothetical protein
MTGIAEAQDATVACGYKQGVIRNDHRMDCSMDAIVFLVELQRCVCGADFAAQSIYAATTVLNFVLVLVLIDDFVKRQYSSSDCASRICIEGGEPTSGISSSLR